MSVTRIPILVAIVAGIVMVGGAWVLQQQEPDTDTLVEPTGEGLSARKHIPVTDSDRDRVPDWQDKLIENEPIFIDELATTAEPFVPPDTLTGQISYKYFQDLLTLDQYGLVEEGQDKLIEGALQEMDEVTKAQTYTQDDLPNLVTTNDAGALRAYGNLVAGTIFHFQTNDPNEYQIFQQMTQDENPRHLERLATIEQQYETIISALLKLEVPEQYTFEHLAIINALSALKQDTHGMQLYFDDPLYAATRYGLLPADVTAFHDAILNLYNRLHDEEKIEFADNETLPVMVELLQ